MTPTPTPVPTTETTPTVQPTAREQVYAQYEQLYGQPPQDPAPAAPVETTPPQAPPPTPVEPPQPSTPALPPEYLDTIRSLQNEITALRSALPPPPEPPPTPAPPDPLDHLRQGRYNEFVDALTAQVRSAVAPATTAEAVTQALQMFRVESEVTKFLSDLRSQNPEIASMEKLGWLDAPIQQRVLAAKEAGTIKSPDDYVRVYKEAVNAEVDKARNFFQTLRAAGKQEALTTKQEVLRATPVTPQAVQSPQPPQEDPNRQETVQDYFAKRRAMELSRQRIA